MRRTSRGIHRPRRLLARGMLVPDAPAMVPEIRRSARSAGSPVPICGVSAWSDRYTRGIDSFAAFDVTLAERRVFDTKYRSLSLYDKLVTQAVHKTYHTGLFGVCHSVLVLRRKNPGELSEFLAAHPCALSGQQKSDARIYSDWS